MIPGKTYQDAFNEIANNRGFTLTSYDTSPLLEPEEVEEESEEEEDSEEESEESEESEEEGAGFELPRDSQSSGRTNLFSGNQPGTSHSHSAGNTITPENQEERILFNPKTDREEDELSDVSIEFTMKTPFSTWCERNQLYIHLRLINEVVPNFGILSDFDDDPPPSGTASLVDNEVIALKRSHHLKLSKLIPNYAEYFVQKYRTAETHTIVEEATMLLKELQDKVFDDDPRVQESYFKDASKLSQTLAKLSALHRESQLRNITSKYEEFEGGIREKQTDPKD